MEDKVLSMTLNGKNKEELIEILNFFNIKVPKNILKKKLVEKVLETYSTEHKEFLKILSKETQLFVNKFISNNLKMDESVVDKKFDCIFELEFFGLVLETSSLDEEKKVFTLSEAFANMFSKECNTASGKRVLKTCDELEKIFTGIIRFYGIISEQQFFKIVTRFYPEMNFQEIDNFMLKRFSLKSLFHKIFNSGTNEFFYFSDFVQNPEELMRKFFLRPQLDYKILEKEEYQSFWKLDYYNETDDFLALENFFRHNRMVKIEARHATLDTILDMRNGTSFGEIFQQLISKFNLGSKEESENFTTHLQALYNSTSQWELKGHTPEDVFNMKLDFQPTFTQRKVDKISRNDACPCGSEKKYKKCCGK